MITDEEAKELDEYLERVRQGGRLHRATARRYLELSARVTKMAVQQADLALQQSQQVLRLNQQLVSSSQKLASQVLELRVTNACMATELFDRHADFRVTGQA